MKNIFNRIRGWFLKHTLIDDTLRAVPAANSKITQEDPRTMRARKNVAKAFKAQQQVMQTMSLKSHRIDCDITNCNNSICFIPEPDKIVTSQTVSRKKTVGVGRYQGKDQLDIK